MNFSKLLLGYQEIEEIIKLGIREKYITSYTNEYINDSNIFDAGYSFKNIVQIDDFFVSNNRIKNKSSLLRLIMIYDNIDSNRFMPFNINRLIDSGLFSENVNFNKLFLKDRPIENKLNEILKNEKLYGTRQFLDNLFIDIEKHFKIDLYSCYDIYYETKLCDAIDDGDIDTFKKLLEILGIKETIEEGLFSLAYYDTELFVKKFKLNKLNEFEVDVKIINEFIEKYIISPVMKFILNNNKDNYSERIYLLNKYFTIGGNQICSSCKYKNNMDACELESDCEHVMRKYVSLEDIFLSFEHNIPLFSSDIKSSNISIIDSTNIIDELYKLIKKSEVSKLLKISFKQLNSLPEPKSLKEALYLRNQPEIISFRNIFKSWCESLQDMNDEATIKLITNDFNKASEYIERQYKRNNEAKKIGNVFINIIIDILGGINGISHLMLPYTIKKRFTERDEANERQKYEWFLLTK